MNCYIIKNVKKERRKEKIIRRNSLYWTSRRKKSVKNKYAEKKINLIKKYKFNKEKRLKLIFRLKIMKEKMKFCKI